MSAIGGLGEIALRVNDLPRMRGFYEGVVGLQVMREMDRVVFFRIADGHAGHTTILALFDRDVEVGAEHTTVDHLAFSIASEDYESERNRLESAGCKVLTAEHTWVGWRSLYIEDPEGNTVEFVCYDEQVLDERNGAVP